MTAERHKAMPITERNPLPAPQQDQDASRFTKTFCRTFIKTFAQNIFGQNIELVVISSWGLLPKHAQLPLPDDVIEELRKDRRRQRGNVENGRLWVSTGQENKWVGETGSKILPLKCNNMEPSSYDFPLCNSFMMSCLIHFLLPWPGQQLKF